MLVVDALLYEDREGKAAVEIEVEVVLASYAVDPVILKEVTSLEEESPETVVLAHLRLVVDDV